MNILPIIGGIQWATPDGYNIYLLLQEYNGYYLLNTIGDIQQIQ